MNLWLSVLDIGWLQNRQVLANMFEYYDQIDTVKRQSHINSVHIYAVCGPKLVW